MRDKQNKTRVEREYTKGSLKRQKGCKFGPKKEHAFDRSLPQSWPHLTQKYGSASKYYNRPYTKEEKTYGRLTFERCIHCGKIKWGLVKEGESLNK